MPAQTTDIRTSVTQLLLRAGAGSMLIVAHGWPKLSHFAEQSTRFPDPLHIGSPASLGLVVIAEVLCAGLVVLGLVTRWAVLPVLIFFVVTVVVQHAPDPFFDKELATLYALSFAAVAVLGPGRFSLDAARGVA